MSLEPPSLKCVDLVYEELMKFCHGCTSSELIRFPRLHSSIIDVVSDVLRERLKPTLDSVRSLIAIQVAYINTQHPQFTEMTAELMKALTTRREQLKQGPSKRRGPAESIRVRLLYFVQRSLELKFVHRKRMTTSSLTLTKTILRCCTQKRR